MRWPTAFLLSVMILGLTASVYFVTGCVETKTQAYEACMAAHGNSATILPPAETGTGVYEIVTPCSRR